LKEKNKKTKLVIIGTKIRRNKVIKIEQGKKYLITGGAGFLGGELIERILNQGGEVITVSRNEGKLIELKSKYKDSKLEIHTGDICDEFTLPRLMQGITGVFHLAAFKHVGLAETQGRECIKSNVIGSMNVLEQAVKNDVEFVIGISTDKAAQVSGTYGATKYLMERMFTQFEQDYPQTKFRIVRYGNVLYSTGSVLCIWKDKLQKGEEIIVTDPEATRYFWTLDQAVDLIFDCMENATTSHFHFPSMKSMSMGNLLNAMADKYLPEGQELKVKTIGLQIGENLHEKISEDGLYSNEAEQFTIEEIKELI
jgi:UDP-N-acetylglucosamine 4,6-dehydratase/UDP-glucose 4-epimerase